MTPKIQGLFIFISRDLLHRGYQHGPRGAVQADDGARQARAVRETARPEGERRVRVGQLRQGQEGLLHGGHVVEIRKYDHSKSNN